MLFLLLHKDEFRAEEQNSQEMSSEKINVCM